MGAGKGYLTFALYDYLRYTLGKDCTVTGVEFRQDLVDQCNQVAKDCAFDQLHFEQGTIEGYGPGRRPPYPDRPSRFAIRLPMMPSIREYGTSPRSS
ncbi:MAG: SAM-dependent methyltransferase [Taibaiella sp.]|nr:SAM-dependent methyltransferase [Taibaiella sp.]